MTYIVTPGVRQDHRGRLFRNASYPNGKCITVPYLPTGAPPARMIPVPQPQARGERPLPTYTAPDGSKRPVLHVPKRMHVVEWRDAGQEAVFKDFGPTKVMQAFVEEQLRPLMQSPDNGKTWLVVSAPCDYHVQYHTDEEPA